MKKAKKLALQRLTMGRLSAATGGIYQTRGCYGSYDQGCSESCNTCQDGSQCFSVGYGCSSDCPPDWNLPI